MPHLRTKHWIRIAFLVLVWGMWQIPHAFAATQTWTGATNNDWTNGSNWGGTAPASGDTANIPGGLTNYPIITSSVTITALNINSSGSGASVTVSSGGTLTGTGGITNGGFLLTVAGAGDTTFSTTAISGTGALTKTDAGTLTLSGANTYSGATNQRRDFEHRGRQQSRRGAGQPDGPIFFQRSFKEKLEATDGHGGRVARVVFDVLEMEKVLAQLFLRDQVWGL